MKVVSPTGGRFGIGEGAHAPGAGRRRGDQRHRQRAAADALVGHDGAAIFDAVRTLDHQRQRHAERGDALAVAQQRGDMHGLAGAVDAALGIDERIEAGRHRAAGDAAVGEIEGRRLQAEEGVVALARRSRPACAGDSAPSPRVSPASNCT